MKVAAKTSWIAATIAAAAILAACFILIAATKNLLMDKELEAARRDYDVYVSRALQAAADAGSGVLESDRSDPVVQRFLYRSVPGYEEFALETDDGVVFNDTGVAARSFLDDKGVETGEPERSFRYGCLRDGEEYLLVLGASPGTREDAFSLSLVRDITALFRELDYLTVVGALTGGCALAGCAALIFFFMRRALGPLQKVRTALGAVAAGDYSVRLEMPGCDEFSELARDCGRMAEAIQGKVNEIERLAEDRRLLLMALSHEMRTPITGISAYAQTLSSIKLSEEQLASGLQAVRGEALRLERLSTKLGRLLGTGEKDLKLETVTASSLARRIENLLAAREEEVAFEVRIAEASYLADADLIVSLVLNLIENAVRARASRVLIEFDRDLIAVADDGIGIPADKLSEICKPFYRRQSSRSGEGFGLGLALAKRIADLHGAKLRFCSQEGVGTRASLAFGAEPSPAQEEDARGAE